MKKNFKLYTHKNVKYTILIQFIFLLFFMLKIYNKETKFQVKTQISDQTFFDRKSVLSKVNFEICILTSLRPKNTSYLETNLMIFKEQGYQLNDITIINIDNSIKNKTFFNNENVFMPYINSLRRSANCAESDDVFSKEIPCKVQQSNYDVALTMGLCESIATKKDKKWVLFIEDDMEPCPESLNTLQSELLKSNNYCAIKFSKFSRAFAMKVGKSILNFVTELYNNVKTYPYDHVLWGNIWNKECTVKTHNFNLFHHKGLVSTIAYRNNNDYIKEYFKLRNDFCGENLQ